MAPRSCCVTLFLALTLLVQSACAAASDSAMSVLNSTDDIKVGPAILAVVGIAVGVFMLVVGYRLFRIAIFVCGFILGGIGVASFLEWVFANRSWMATASWVGFFVGGLLVGLIAMSMYTLSIFVAGATGGVLLAFTIHTSFAYRIWESHPNIVLLVLAVLLGIVFGVLALKLEKPVIIISTSFIGAIAIAWGIGYFAGDFPNGADLKRSTAGGINGDTLIAIPDAWWAYLAGIVVLFVLGLYIQFRKTGRGEKHHHVKGLMGNHRAIPPSNDPYGNVQTPPTAGSQSTPV